MAREERSRRLLTPPKCRFIILVRARQPTPSLSDWQASMRNGSSYWWLPPTPWREKQLRHAAQNGSRPTRYADCLPVGDEPEHRLVVCVPSGDVLRCINSLLAPVLIRELQTRWAHRQDPYVPNP